MILLACSEQRIVSRWRQGLQGYKPIHIVSCLNELRKKLRTMPDAMVIFHHSLPGVRHEEDIRSLLIAFPAVRLMVLSDVPDEHEGIELIRDGVLGYANTHIKPEILHEAVKVIGLGEIWVSKRLLEWMVSHCHDTEAGATEHGSYLALDALTPGERHVLDHLTQGDNNKDIARKLNITERTVKAHLTSIYSKTGVKDRLHLALLVNNTRSSRAI